MKAVCVALVLALVAVSALPVDHLRFAQRRRVGGTWADGKYTCPDLAGKDSTGGHVWGNLPVGNPTNVKQDADFTFVTADAGNEKIGYDSSSGKALTGTMKSKNACDMCKVRPKEMCAHDGAGFCGVIGDGYCCIKKDGSVAQCKAKGVGRKYMPQLMEKIGDVKVDVSKVESYAKLLTWLGTQGVKNGANNGKAEKKKCQVSKLTPTQDEIFWDKSIGKVCYTFTNGALAMRASNAVSGTPDTPPFVDKDCKIIDGHHRWSQAALCSLVTNCAPPAEIDVVQTDLSATDVLKKLIDFAKGDNGWKKAGQSNEAKAELKNDEATVFYVSTGAADFVEVDSKFGRSAHQSLAQAAEAFVQDRRSALAEIGVELKGGDEALEDLFMTYHAPRLWN